MTGFTEDNMKSIALLVTVSSTGNQSPYLSVKVFSFSYKHVEQRV